MQIPKPSPEDMDRFRSIVPAATNVVVKPMFGNLGAFVNGNMFMGLHEDRMILRLSDPDREVLTAWGAFGEKQMYGKTVTGVIRSTFLIDAEGKVEEALYNVKATGHVAKLRRDLRV